MYNLISDLLQIPYSNVNTTITYIAGALILLFSAILIDLVYRLLRALFSRGKFD